MREISTIFITKVLCYNEKEQGLLGKSDDLWIDVAVDLSKVIAVKKDIKEDKEQTAIYFSGDDYFVVETGYDEMVDIWRCCVEKTLYLPE